ncbi:MAG: hypothetical protein NC252_08145 [Roseburia sp.]|nr:hypothetical protein [Roseburia sp.]MCM1421136.1 hypothetical protein [Bacteroides sp.]MCM1511091.1 hypothetical protein [Clostridium sp.]
MANSETTVANRKIIDDILKRDMRFRYMFLSRLQSDCEYYINYGCRSPRCLWAGKEKLQIELMTAVYNSFPETEKPEWLTVDKIMTYSIMLNQ